MIKKVLVMVSILILGTLLWGVKEGSINIPFVGTGISVLPPEGTPKLAPISSKTYSGMLYEVVRRDDGGAWFTVLMNEEKAVRKLGVAPDVAAGANTADLKVGDAVLLTVQSKGVQQEVVEVLKQDNPLLWTLAGKVVSFSGKKMVLSWYENEINVNMGETVKLSVKYDRATNTPGQQTEVDDFSLMKVGDVVVVGIDRAASSGNLVVNTVQVLN